VGALEVGLITPPTRLSFARPPAPAAAASGRGNETHFHPGSIVVQVPNGDAETIARHLASNVLMHMNR